MGTLWFALVAFMLTMYVVLDGFDLGAGILHLFVARSPKERSILVNTIAHVWDGNEVWLLAAGGTLYFAFPMLYASAFSGFYLPLTIVLWLLMARAAGIELRHYVHHPLWLTFWDAAFCVASALLAVFFGAALGNVVRGVPLNADGYFFEPLWTTFTIVPETGILDWFTTLMGLVALATLTLHGANYLAMKTTDELQRRARNTASVMVWVVVLTSLAAFAAVWSFDTRLWNNFNDHPWGFLFPIAGAAGLALTTAGIRSRRDGLAFTGSSLFIGGMLGATAFSLYPLLLPASTDLSRSITIENAAAAEYGLSVGLRWWTIGMLLAGSYFVIAYRTFRGKVTEEDPSSCN
jgi:cytochrome d ubiquinol oxidase subunit II